MNPSVYVAGVVSIGLCASLPSRALGSILGQVTVTPGIPTSTRSSADENFSIALDGQDLRADHGYSQLALDFRGGLLRGRNHACVSPTESSLNHAAIGDMFLSMSSETFVVRGDGLPIGASVSVKFCVEMSSDIKGYVIDPAFVGSSDSKTVLSFGAGSGSVIGTHLTGQYWENTSGTGAFAGMSDDLVTVMREFTVLTNVGQSLSVAAGATSKSRGAASYHAGNVPEAMGSAGFAMTFGIVTMTAGAHLEWRGSAWTGRCGGSLALIPPNPVPSPSVAAALLVPLASWSRRSRRPSSSVTPG